MNDKDNQGRRGKKALIMFSPIMIKQIDQEASNQGLTRTALIRMGMQHYLEYIRDRRARREFYIRSGSSAEVNKALPEIPDIV